MNMLVLHATDHRLVDQVDIPGMQEPRLLAAMTRDDDLAEGGIVGGECCASR